MTPKDEALRLALDLATMHHTDDGYTELRSKVRQLAKDALAQPEHRPVAEVRKNYGTGGDTGIWQLEKLPAGTQLYRAPPKREPLTREQIAEVWKKGALTQGYSVTTAGVEFARSIELAHGIGETQNERI